MAFQFLMYVIVINLFIAIVLNHFFAVHESLSGPRHTWRTEVPSDLYTLGIKLWWKVYPIRKRLCGPCNGTQEHTDNDRKYEDFQKRWLFEAQMGQVRRGKTFEHSRAQPYFSLR